MKNSSGFKSEKFAIVTIKVLINIWILFIVTSTLNINRKKKNFLSFSEGCSVLIEKAVFDLYDKTFKNLLVAFTENLPRLKNFTIEWVRSLDPVRR